MPQSVTELKGFLGLVNQLGHFLPDLAHMTAILRTLLKKNVAFVWLPEHQQEFDEVKSLLTSDMLVYYAFDPALSTELLTDASRLKGVGYALIQRETSGKIRLIACGSRSLTPAQRNYATIELECMAIVWAVAKFGYYLRGMGLFTVVTDHKPLVGAFAKPLHELENARLARFREKLVEYSFNLVWSLGKDHMIADALSRAPVFAGEEMDEECMANAVVCNRISEDPAMQDLFDAVDDEYKMLISAVRNASGRDHRPPSCAAYAAVWPHLSLYDEEDATLVLLHGIRVVVPRRARPEILRKLHMSHAGQIKMYQNARQLYYWPSMKNQIKQMVEGCQACLELLPTQGVEPTMQSWASEPMEQVGADLFDFQGQDWIVMVDRFSGFPMAARLTKTTTEAVTTQLTKWFHDWGFPKRIRTDGGPQFRRAFDEYCAQHCIVHELSSPYHPQSNGLAKSGVKNMKYLLTKCKNSGEDFRAALLEWRNTPRADGFSPNQAFLGRRPRGALPDLGMLKFDQEAFKVQRKASRENEETQFNSRAKDLRKFEINDRIIIQNPINKRWDLKARVLSQHNPRSYEVQTEDGKIFVRNGRFLRADTALQEEQEVILAENNAELRRSARIANQQ